MKRQKGESNGGRRFKLSHCLLGVAAFYLIYMLFKFPQFLEISTFLNEVDSNDGLDGLVTVESGAELAEPWVSGSFKDIVHRKLEDDNINTQLTPTKEPWEEDRKELESAKPLKSGYGRITGEIMRNGTAQMSVLESMADEAWILGSKAWEEVYKSNGKDDVKGVGDNNILEEKRKSCPSWVSMRGEELVKRDRTIFLPCGLAAGSSVTVVGTPNYAHQEYVPQSARTRKGERVVTVSQFMIELQGLKVVDGEDPPKILHLNPRIRGDWSHQPVIEHNTCYRMQWGKAQRCDGLPSKNDDDMLVDGHLRCEKWMRNEIADTKESKTTSWFKRFIGRAQKPEVTWPFPFVEGRLFILTIRAGIDGYHINVGGRHITSFPYRTGFTLEDATGLVVKGEVDVHSVYATSLPISHPSFSPRRALEMVEKWKAPPLPNSPFQLFMGILSATNHFAERMAVRKTWLQSKAIKSSNVVVRFFVALNPRKEVNAVLRKEADYFGDIVILPFMDHYELVVLKTIAICEFGVQNVTVDYIMKCDDDTFVRVDTVLKEIVGIHSRKALYMGNLNLLHRPLRSGKWAVTYEEWPEEVYPPYANGPGYIISSDIAKFIVSQHNSRRLRIFKMEDVSMGMWVEQFNSSSPVQYSHDWKFCQYGCMENYFTAHYQSPRQMTCLWDQLARGGSHCCNFR